MLNKTIKFLCILCIFAFAFACSGGGGDSTPAFTNIQGNVSSSNARGDFEGIDVTIQEDPSFTAMTDNSGAFEIIGIPSGQTITLVFTSDSQSASLQVDTPANTTVILQNINLNPNTGLATASQTVVSSSSSSSSASSVSSSNSSSSANSNSSSSDDDDDNSSSSDDDDNNSSSSDDDDESGHNGGNSGNGGNSDD